MLAIRRDTGELSENARTTPSMKYSSTNIEAHCKVYSLPLMTPGNGSNKGISLKTSQETPTNADSSGRQGATTSSQTNVRTISPTSEKMAPKRKTGFNSGCFMLVLLPECQTSSYNLPLMTEQQEKDHDTISRTDHASGGFRQWCGDARQVIRYALQHAAEKKLTQVASSLTFTTVLAIVPMLAVILALFTAFPLFAEFRMALEEFLINSLLPPTVSDTVMQYLNQFAAQASRLTAVGTVFLLVASVMLISTIDAALNDIWQVEQQRPLPQRMLVYWAIITLGPVLAGASLWFTSYLAQQALLNVGEISSGMRFWLSLIPMVITGIAFTGLFVCVPNRQVYWRDALAGGLGSAVVLEVMKSGFAYYITKFPSYTVIYGAFATLPIFLLWIYLSWLAILFGATVAATLPSLRLRRWAVQRQPGATFIDAIRIIRVLRSAQGSDQPGRTTRFLGAHLRLHPAELHAVMRTLKSLGHVVVTQEKGQERWVLACDLRNAQLGTLADALLIDRNQSGLADDPALMHALATVLASTTPISLEDVLNGKTALPETAASGQNKIAVSETETPQEAKPC